MVACAWSLLLHQLLLVLPLGGPPRAARSPASAPLELVFPPPRSERARLAPPQPESAQLPDAPDTPFVSERDTRAQDRVPGGEDRIRARSTGELPIAELQRASSAIERQAAAARAAESSPPRAAPRQKPPAAGDGHAPPAFPQTPPPGPRYLRLPAAGAPAPQPQGARLTLEAPSANATGHGDLALSTYAWRWVPYMRALRDRIERNLHPPPAFARLGVIEGETRLRFRIHPDGHLDGPLLLSSSGHESLDQASLHSVRAAAPMAPLPDDFPDQRLDVVFTYYYFVPDWARRRLRPPAR